MSRSWTGHGAGGGLGICHCQQPVTEDVRSPLALLSLFPAVAGGQRFRLVQSPPPVRRPRASDKDRFSDLTDDLLKHALSFLPPDEALQTCVLDTRWRDLWRRAHESLVLMFEDERARFPFSENIMKLAKLIVRVRGISPLVKCQIDTYPDDEVVEQWL